MKDGCGREISYLRISVTDRCDLRCVYCMPEAGVEPLSHAEILRYEEIQRLATIFASLGVKKIRLTGGEPLTRAGLPGLLAAIRNTPGIETLALTTNGMLLEDALPALVSAGLDAVNISLDTLREDTFQSITRRNGVERVLRAIDAACAVPRLTVKLNCVPTDRNMTELPALARFAAQRHIPLRFIELMPIGEGKNVQGLSEAAVTSILEAAFGPMTLRAAGGADKCRRFMLPDGGEIGFISAMSHRFCKDCNRVRLTAAGYLKTCLQFDTGVDLKALLNKDDDTIRAAIRTAILQKPAQHHFEEASPDCDDRKMSQIGG